MRLRKIKIRLKCDNGVCPNYADFAVEREGTPACRDSPGSRSSCRRRLISSVPSCGRSAASPPVRCWLTDSTC